MSIVLQIICFLISFWILLALLQGYPERKDLLPRSEPEIITTEYLRTTNGTKADAIVKRAVLEYLEKNSKYSDIKKTRTMRSPTSFGNPSLIFAQRIKPLKINRVNA